jgi:hypothetical protein
MKKGAGFKGGKSTGRDASWLVPIVTRFYDSGFSRFVFYFAADLQKNDMS